MSISFSIAITAKITGEELARIKAAGFTCVDLPADALGVTSRVRDSVTAAGLSIACVTTSVWDETALQIIDAIMPAHKLSPFVRILPGKLAKGESIFAGIARLSPQLNKLASTAAKNGVKLALQNAGSFTSVHHLWQLIESAEHDSIVACLDVPTSTLLGESPILTVPTLNTRIAHVRVWDYKENKPAALGQGDAKIKLAIERLRGIGYSNVVAYAPPTGVDFSDEAALQSIAHDLQLWAGVIKPEPAKPAATPAASAH